MAGLSYVFDKKDSLNSFLWLALPALLLAALICRSWHSLLVNYGKLNAAKFKVIGKLEAEIGIRMFDAEWIALGKGVRKSKYQSFTASEANVPKVLMVFFIGSALIAMAYLLFPLITSVLYPLLNNVDAH